MNIERFTTLCETYGGRIAVWPLADRDAARALVQADASARTALAHADALDAVLDEWRVEPASATLRAAVLESATAYPRLRANFSPWLRDVRLWFAGAGLAAGLAGVFCGAVLSTVAVGEQRDEALVASAVSDTAVTTPGAAQT